MNGPTGIDQSAEAATSAVRSASQIVIEPIELVGLHGRPFAPEGLEPCDEMWFYMAQWGLPERFRGIGYRESNCRNDVTSRPGCCHGYLQLWVTLHLKDHRMAPGYAACEVDEVSDIKGNDPYTKQRHMCAAAVLYDVMGTSPWKATR